MKLVTKIILVQQNNDVYLMLKNLMAISKTNLTRVCEEHELDYGVTVKRLNKESIELEYIEEFINIINPEAIFEVDDNISLCLNGQLIFTQKTEK